MDEPFAGVDAATERAIVDVLQVLQRDGPHGRSASTTTSRRCPTISTTCCSSTCARSPTGRWPTTFTAENLQATYGGRLATAHRPARSCRRRVSMSRPLRRPPCSCGRATTQRWSRSGRRCSASRPAAVGTFLVPAQARARQRCHHPRDPAGRRPRLHRHGGAGRRRTSLAGLLLGLGGLGQARPARRRVDHPPDPPGRGRGDRRRAVRVLRLGIVLLTVVQTMSQGGRRASRASCSARRPACCSRPRSSPSAGLSPSLVVLAAAADDAGGLRPRVRRRVGVDVRRMDLAMMGLVLAVTVIGLKIVGLGPDRGHADHPPRGRPVLDRAHRPAGADRRARGRRLRLCRRGALGLGAATADGPIIVLVCFASFSPSACPRTGASSPRRCAAAVPGRVHRRQGLLALAHGEPIFDRLTLTVLRRAGLHPQGRRAHREGREQAAKVQRDERRWEMARQIHQDETVSGRYDGLTPSKRCSTQDEIAAIDRRIGGQRPREEQR